jgi:hypothetical protein
MESLGGDMPAGQPVAVSSRNANHVFAIGKGSPSGNGPLNLWTSIDGGPWPSSPSQLGTNLPAAIPSAVVLADGSVHVFAIGMGSIFSGGPLLWWSSLDGNSWTAGSDPSQPLGANGNGLAAVSSNGTHIDVFAATNGGITQFTFAPGQPLPTIGQLPYGGGLGQCVLAAVSSDPDTIDLFAVEPNLRMPLHWHFNNGWTGPVLLNGPTTRTDLLHGVAVVSPGPGRVNVFAITDDNRVTTWSIKNGAPDPFQQLNPGAAGLPAGLPAAVAHGGKLEVFATGAGGVFSGGALLRWQWDGTWSGVEVFQSSLAAGGVAAIRTANGPDVFGFQSGFNNPLLHWPDGIGAFGSGEWHNWAGNRNTKPIQGHCYPTCLDELVAIVRSASKQGKRARAVGSSWSFSDIAVTGGYVIETNRLTRVLSTVLPTALWGSATSIVPNAPFSHHFVHVEAGIQLEALMGFLDANMMAPATMGGASGQTLGGVISTSVHGSHFRLPPFPDWVRAVHLVGPDGKQYWIEPMDRPITNPIDHATLQQALGPDVTIIHDTEWFQTALVTVGSLGVVYSVVLEVRGQYQLQETRSEQSWLQVKPQIANATSSAFSVASDECVSVAIDPGSMGSADPRCIFITRAEVPIATAPTAGQFDALGAFCDEELMFDLLFTAAGGAGQAGVVVTELLGAVAAVPGVAILVLDPLVATGLATLTTAVVTGVATAGLAASILLPIISKAGPGALGDVIGVVLDKHPTWVAALSTTVTMQFQGPTPLPLGGPIGLAHNIMGPANKGECATRGFGLEIAFPANGSHITFIDAALVLMNDEMAMGNVLGGWFSIRFVGASRAILSPQQTAMTCMVEVVGLRSLTSTRVLLDKLEMLGSTLGGIQHWGMFNALTGPAVASAYPRLSAWRRIRRQLTNGGTIHTFDNDFTRRCGLSDGPVRIDRIVFNPPGPDVAGEYVVIQNESASAVSVTNWTLRDAANHVFHFPAFALGAGSDTKVWTKVGTNDATNLFWGHKAAIWNNSGDTAILRDQLGTEIARYAY